MFSSVRVSKPDKKSVTVIFSSGNIPKLSSKAAVTASKRAGFKFGASEISESYSTEGHAIIVGIGKGSMEDWRLAGSSLARFVAKNSAQNLSFEGDGFQADHAQVISEQFGLLAWNPVLYRGTGVQSTERRPILLQSKNSKIISALKTGLALAECTNLCRTLVQTPPNIATPTFMANAATRLSKETKMKCIVLKGKQLENEKLVGLITVGQASENLPCFIRLEYAPKGTEKQKPIVLLGKTVTYDTGGLSLKDKTGMRGMKVDKAGGCAVLGAMAAIAKVYKPKKRIVALLVAAENSVSDEAYRPDDVITFRNGVTVEVTNTDAEGRLVLADGLCWACDVEKAECIVDIATLTGGVVRALGSVYAGLFANNDYVCDELVCAANETDELLWRLPLHPRYKELMKSQVADIVNSNLSGAAHPVQGAIFLECFVKPGIKWAHIDMAGKGWNEKDGGGLVPGPTGYGVQTLAKFAAGM